MAHEKLSQLAASSPATLPLTGAELVYLVQGGISKGTTAAALAGALPDATTTTAGKLSAADKARLDQLGVDDSPSFAGLTITGPNAAIIPHIHGSLAGPIYFHVKNVSGGPLLKGTPVTAGDSVGNTDVLQVVATDPATPGAEYANGVLFADLAANGEGHAIMVGELQDMNTAAYSRGPLWVAGGGGLTSTRPASGAQQVATLGRQHAVNGSLLVAIQGVEPTPAQLGAATAAQGAKADSAVQPAALSTALASKADLVGGVIPTSQIPAIAISDYLGSVNSEAAMLALTGQRGDWCLRTDSGAVGQWILSGDNAALVANWVRITVPASPVQSVNGQVGAVVLGPADIGAASTAVVSNAAAGLAPAIGTPSGRYLRDDATWATVPSGGGGSPAGTATEIQYRDGAAFGAIPGSVVNGATGAVQLAGLGAGVPPKPGYSIAMGSGVLPRAQVVTAVGSTYTCDIRAANRFMLGAAIAGNTTIAFFNVADLAVAGGFAEYVEVEVDFFYTSGIITISAAGFTTKWDGNTAATLTASEFETLVVRITPAVTGTPFTTPTVCVAPMRGTT
jgi:hypothetical protein